MHLTRSHRNRIWLSSSAARLKGRLVPFATALVQTHHATLILGLLVVAAVQFWRLWPIQSVLDWPLWDESNYAASGAAWMHHGGSLGDLHTSPLYIASYGLLSCFGDLPFAIFAQHYLVKIISTALLYVLFARLWNSWVAAAAFALLWGATQFQLEFPILVYQFAWLWFLAALVTIDVWPICGLELLALAVCVRQEYQFALLLAVCWLPWKAWRDRWTIRQWFAPKGGLTSAIFGSSICVILSLLIAFIASHTAFRHSADRLWFAFEQHYAVRAVAVKETAITNPWLDYPKVVQKDFPGARSLSGAARINPSAFAKHIEFNLVHAPLEVFGLFSFPSGVGVVVALLSIVAIAGLGAATAPMMRDLGKSELIWITALGGIIAIVPTLVVFSKGAYLLPAVPIVVLSISALVSILLSSILKSPAITYLGATVFFIAILQSLTTPKQFQIGSRPRPVAETMPILQNLWPTHGREALVAVAASSYAHYIGDDRCLAVEAISEVAGFNSKLSFAQLVQANHPFAVMVTDEWRQSTRFTEAEILDSLPKGKWRQLEVPAGTLYLRNAGGKPH